MSWKILILCIYQPRMKITSTSHRSTPSPDNQEILIPRFRRTQKDDYPCQASIRFDDLWKHLVSEAQKETKSNFKVKFDNPIQGLCLCVVVEVCYLDCWYTPGSTLARNQNVVMTCF
ncbi:hypothetical protein Ac2012v2_005365 [Leucoagaricus gongylophorus]